jgi:hypothetical protein
LKERDGIELSVSTLRRPLIAAKLWTQTRNSSEYHARWEPRGRFGELAQFDGSNHEWFEKRGPRCTSITLIDFAVCVIKRQRSCHGIEVIAANSPQAKGRFERNHGLDQDRLVVVTK